MKTIIILSHGSKSKNSNVLTEKVAKGVSEALNQKVVIANLQLASPYLNDVVKNEYDSGTREFIVHPFFLHKGVHVEKDIPEEIEKLKSKYPDAYFSLTDVTGTSELVIKAVISLVRESL